MVDTKKVEKKAAPIDFVKNPFYDERAYIAELEERKNPDFVYMYQKRDVDKWELQMKNQEVVLKDDGSPVNHMGDPLVRVPREIHEEKKRVSNEFSIKQATRIRKNADQELATEDMRKTAKPKKAKN